MRVGIDVGGTFTDIIVIDDATGTIKVTKTHTTPEDFSKGVINALKKFQSVKFNLLVHGTTVGTNALIEKKGAKTALLTTNGMRDILEIGRIQRPAEGLYDFNVDNPPPLVPRYLRMEVSERIDAKGNIVIPLNKTHIKTASKTLKKEGIESVAVSFIFSFLNPTHENTAKTILKKYLPKTFISLSSEIAPEFREYERTSTVVTSAYLQPIVEKYVKKLITRLKKDYPNLELRLIQANGGTMTADSVKGKAVNLVNSGPAGGATAAAFLGKLLNRKKIIAVDMGGTSFDVSLIEDGKTQVSTDVKFDGYPLKIPMQDVSIIGAGGGSIAWLDKGDALNVGPQSAGAKPGPACYGKGGKEPTVTDANLVLGRIDASYFLGGEVKLYPELSKKAIKERLCKRLKLSPKEVAYGIIRVVNANMAKAISIRSTQKGYDLREFSLVSFGGAGALHAVEIAEELGISEVIIPLYPGAFSAFGLITADTRHDYVKTIMQSEDKLKTNYIYATFKMLEKQGEKTLEKEGIPKKRRRLEWSADLKYEGQSYELNIPVKKENLTRSAIHKLFKSFNEKHESIYSFKGVDEKIVFVNARVSAIGKSPDVKLKKLLRGSTNPKNALKSQRKVYFGGRGFISTNIYERDLLRANNIVKGPAVIEEKISCSIVPPKKTACVDIYGNIIIQL